MTVGITPDPGLVGPTGPTGAAGATGPTGPTGAAGGSNVAVFTHTQTSGTGGGGFLGGGWRTMTVNTSQYNGISGSSISSNQITLPSGTYLLDGMANAQGGLFSARLKLRNITDSSDTLTGRSTEVQFGVSSNPITIQMVLRGVFTIAAQKTFEIQIYPETGNSTDGQGQAGGSGAGSVTETYSEYIFMKIG